MDGAQQGRIDEQMRFLNIVCVALVASVAVYVLVAWYLTDGPGGLRPLMGQRPTTLIAIVLFLAVALLVVTPFLHRRLLDRAERPGPGGDLGPVLHSYQMAIVLSFTLREGAALLGLMLTLLTGQAFWCYGLGALTIVAMFWGWPRSEDLLELAR